MINIVVPALLAAAAYLLSTDDEEKTRVEKTDDNNPDQHGSHLAGKLRDSASGHDRRKSGVKKTKSRKNTHDQQDDPDVRGDQPGNDSTGQSDNASRDDQAKQLNEDT